MEMVAQISGWTGTVLFLLAYYLVTFKKVEATSRLYQILNLIGAVALGVNVFYAHAWPARALEIIWVIIAIVALVRRSNYEERR